MKKTKNGLLLLLILLVGLVIGGILGDIFSGTLPILGYGRSIGFDPFQIDLNIIKITLGFTMTLNLASIIGLLLALFLFRWVS